MHTGKDAELAGLQRRTAYRSAERPAPLAGEQAVAPERPRLPGWQPIHLLRSKPTPTFHPGHPERRGLPRPIGGEQHLRLLSGLGVEAAQARSLDELFERYLNQVLTGTRAQAAAIRLFDDEGKLRLVEAHGLNASFVDAEQRSPAQSCPCAVAGQQRNVQYRHDLRACMRRIGCNPLPSQPHLAMLAVPIIDEADSGVGIFNLYFDPEEAHRWMEPAQLLDGLGRQLGAAISRVRADYQRYHRTLQEERNLLAHELHDTVAQEVATLRLRVRQIEEQAAAGVDTQELLGPLEELRNRLDHTNDQVRTVMRQFRTQALGTPLETALGRLVNRFNRDSGIEVRLINHWPELALGEREQLHIHRIVEEALSNAWHHGKAEHIRIQMESPDGELSLLVEDDGTGFKVDEVPECDLSHPRGHGLQGMRERARHLGAILDVDSDPSQGTAVHLRLPRPQRMTWSTKSLHQAGVSGHARADCR
ncbi:MAG: GAF domain-containing sensor histidine kinase [Halorhodospira sp.]